MTNEERFIASCATVGEADVRSKMSAGRYSERKMSWASVWLENLENSKSDSTKASENNNRLQILNKKKSRSTVIRATVSSFLVVLVAIAFISYLKFG